MGNDKNSKLAGIFVLFGLLLNFPIIGIFTKDGKFFGLPALYCYLFLAWAVLIAILYELSKKER